MSKIKFATITRWIVLLVAILCWGAIPGIGQSKTTSPVTPTKRAGVKGQLRSITPADRKAAAQRAAQRRAAARAKGQTVVPNLRPGVKK